MAKLLSFTLGAISLLTFMTCQTDAGTQLKSQILAKVAKRDLRHSKFLVYPNGLIFSPDHRNVAYQSDSPVPQRYRYILNGKPLKDYNKVSEGVFSPDGKKFAYIASPDHFSVKVVVNETEGKTFKYINSLTFSPTGKIAFLAAETSWPKTKLVLDGEELDFEDPIQNYSFSPDGKSYAVVTGEIPCSTDYCKTNLYINGKLVWKRKGKDRYMALAFSPDSKNIAYLIQKEDKKYYLFINNKAKKLPYEDRVRLMGFLPNSESVVLIGRKGGQDVIIVNGRELKSPGKEFIFTFLKVSPKGENIAYLYRNMDNSSECLLTLYSFINQSYQTIPACFGNFSFSPNGKKFAIGAAPSIRGSIEGFGEIPLKIKIYQLDEKETWVNSMNTPIVNNGDIIKLKSTPVFSPDSQSLAYLEETFTNSNLEPTKYPQSIVINGKRGKKYSQVWSAPTFSADSKYLMYNALLDQEIWLVVEKVK